jgi:ankyrin repeat protein
LRFGNIDLREEVMTDRSRSIFALLGGCAAVLFFALNLPAAEIHDAVRAGDLEKVRMLLESHADWLNSPDQNQKTPLHLALESGHIDIARYLIEKGADINLKDKDKAAPLHNAAYLGNLEIVDLLLNKGAAALNEGNFRGQTPLHFACERGYPEVVSRLLDAGADIEARDVIGRTPLMTTAMSRNMEVVKILIKTGADINATLRRGPATYSTLSVVAMYGFTDLVDLLIDKSAAVSKDTLETTLGLAMQGGHPRLFEYVRENGLDLAPLKGKDPGLVFPAAAGGSPEIMKTLLDHGFALDQKDKDGWTPLHVAAVEGNVKMLEFLIGKGLDKDARNMKGETAYHVARAAEAVEAADFLKKAGADTSAPRFPKLKGPYMGQTPPGDKPERFLPGIVSAHYNAHSPIVFSPDGREAQWTEMSPPEGRVMGMKIVGDTWTYPEPVYEGRDSSFSPDGRRVYFIRVRPFREGEKPAGETDGWECFWYMERKPSGWSEPVSVGEAVNSIGVHWQPSVDKEGHLYFSEFEKNIYRSEYKDKEYQRPVKITELFKNDTLLGRSPFISPDADYLLFSAEDKLHVSFKRRDGTWTDKISLGDEINTQGLNSSPRVTPDGKYIFFVSAGGGRPWGIYWVSAGVLDRLRKEHLKDWR